MRSLCPCVAVLLKGGVPGTSTQAHSCPAAHAHIQPQSVHTCTQPQAAVNVVGCFSHMRLRAVECFWHRPVVECFPHMHVHQLKPCNQGAVAPPAPKPTYSSMLQPTGIKQAAPQSSCVRWMMYDHSQASNVLGISSQLVPLAATRTHKPLATGYHNFLAVQRCASSAFSKLRQSAQNWGLYSTASTGASSPTPTHLQPPPAMSCIASRTYIACLPQENTATPAASQHPCCPHPAPHNPDSVPSPSLRSHLDRA